MQREKGDEAPSESREILDPTSHNQEKVVEVQKPIEKHESKVLKEYELFCSLSIFFSCWGVLQKFFNPFISFIL